MAEKRQPGDLNCTECEPQFAELLEGTLPAAEAARVQRHVDSCAACKAALDDAFRGHAWLKLLRAEDETLAPPSGLVERILARTAGDSIAPAAVAPQEPQAPWANVKMAAVRRSVWYQPRLVLTAAMAFFSVTLTLNVAGIRAVDLKPGNIRHTVERQYLQTNARLVRYYENLRVVYQLESRVRELRRAAEAPQPVTQPAQPAPRTEHDKANRQGKDGSSLQHSDSPAGLAHHDKQAPREQVPATTDTLEARISSFEALERSQA